MPNSFESLQGVNTGNMRYTTRFKNVGAAYGDSLVLLRELVKRGSWDSIVSAAYEENLLKKRSTSFIRMILQNVKTRYFGDHFPLPDGRTLARFFCTVDSYQVEVQTLYQYICQSYPLVNRLIIALVGSNLRRYGAFRLTKTLFIDFLSEEAEEHPEIKEWADYTRDKWRRDFFAFLRSTGLMEKHPGVLVRKPVVRAEAFAFFLLGLVEQGFPSSRILDSHLWKRYFLTEEDLEDMLSECQVRGWLQYRSMGGVSELIPRFNSLEEWIGAIE